MKDLNYYIFGNKPKGAYKGTKWDTESIVRDKKCYFDVDKNVLTHKPKKGDVVIFKEFETLLYWGEAILASDAIVEDEDGVKTARFNFEKILIWEMPVKNTDNLYSALSNKDARRRIVSIKWSDYKIIQSYMHKYTWLQGHRDLVDYLSKNREPKALVNLLKSTGIEALSDKEKGKRIDLEEIDPFTFICYIHKYGIAKRFEIFKKLNASIDISIPDDFLGLPSANAQKVWLFPYKDERQSDEVDRLWGLFDKVIGDQDINDSFDDVLTIKNVGKAKLTEVLFYVRPEDYLPMDKQTIPYLESNGIKTKFNNCTEYFDILKDVKSKINLPFYQISHLAWKGNQEDGIKVAVKDDLTAKNRIEKHPLNQILYGPPGTGKTYELSSRFFDEFTSRKSSVSKEEYVRSMIVDKSWWEVLALVLLDLGTSEVDDIYRHKFLQLKASLSNSNTVRQTVWGQLQVHTVDSCENVKISKKGTPLIFNKTKDKKWEVLEDEIKEQSPELLDLHQKIASFSPQSDIEIKRYDFVTFHQSFSYEDFVEGIKPILTGVEGELSYAIEDGVFKKMCSKARNDSENSYAIFIDEINRGNVSQIFGELITLIEADKREGQENELSVILPYSKQVFSVPKNLHIIGTMNTADRSVEALDTALRRRFQFVEMAPNPDIIEKVNKTREVAGIDLVVLLKTINERIEILLDRDHLIGHSYFLKIDKLEELKVSFSKQIIPLLQEYFYGDYGKVALVLGEGFCAMKEQTDISSLFAKVQDYDADAYAEKRVFELKNPMGMGDDTFNSAISTLLNITADSEK